VEALDRRRWDVVQVHLAVSDALGVARPGEEVVVLPVGHLRGGDAGKLVDQEQAGRGLDDSPPGELAVPVEVLAVDALAPDIQVAVRSAAQSSAVPASGDESVVLEQVVAVPVSARFEAEPACSMRQVNSVELQVPPDEVPVARPVLSIAVPPA